MNRKQRKAPLDISDAEQQVSAYQDFLQKLSRTPRQWFLDRDNLIRAITGGERHCPLSYVAHTVDLSRFAEAGALLGLDVLSIQQIVAAADGRTGEVRDDLLQACGLAKAVKEEESLAVLV